MASACLPRAWACCSCSIRARATGSFSQRAPDAEARRPRRLSASFADGLSLALSIPEIPGENVDVEHLRLVDRFAGWPEPIGAFIESTPSAAVIRTPLIDRVRHSCPDDSWPGGARGRCCPSDAPQPRARRKPGNRGRGGPGSNIATVLATSRRDSRTTTCDAFRTFASCGDVGDDGDGHAPTQPGRSAPAQRAPPGDTRRRHAAPARADCRSRCGGRPMSRQA